jgi:CHAT domain-containing protein
MVKQIIARPRPNFSFRSSLRLSPLPLLLLCIFAYSPNTPASGYPTSSVQSSTQHQSTGAQIAQEVTRLELGKPVERELAGDQTHSYQIALAEAQYVFVVVEQRGIDVFVQLIATDGKLIAVFDFGSQGQERIGMVAETAGSYRLLVKASQPKLPAGRYEIRLVEVRNATEKDRWLHESARLRTESARLADAGKYKEALPLAEQTLELRERLYGAESPWLVHNINNLASLNLRIGDYTKAEALYQRGLIIAEKGMGAEHPQVARFLTNLADTYSRRGNDAGAVPLYQRALSVLEKNFGPDHPQIVHPLHQLGRAYRNMGDFVRAEPLFQRSLMVSKKALGEEHLEVAGSLDNLASLYREKGDYAKAEPLLQRAITIAEKALGANHVDVAWRLNNLGNVYYDQGAYEKAELLYQRALSIKEEVLGPNHADSACTRGNLARISYLRGDYAIAEPLFLTTLATREKALGPNHPMVGLNLSNLANLYVALNDAAKAEPLYHRALSIYETAYGSNYHFLAHILVALSKMSAADGKLAQAVAYQARANGIIEHNLKVNLATGSERQKLAYLVTMPEQMSQAISLHARFAVDDREARELAATTVLQRKGRVQDALSQSLASLHSRFSAEDQALLEQLIVVASQLGRLVLNEPQCTSPAQYQKQIKTLEERREKLESEISQRSAEFYLQLQPVTLAAIQSAIPDNAALIELAVYRPFDPKAKDDKTAFGEPRYVAYIIRRQGAVQWKELGEAKTVDASINTLRQALRDPKRKDVKQLTRAVDERVMQPFRSLLGGATHLLIAPDGALNLIPFEALVDEQGRYLIERYAFNYLTSGRDLLRLQTRRESKSPPVVVADPVFGEPAVVASHGVARLDADARSRPRLDYSQVFFGPLPGIADEVRALKTLLPQATFLTREQATEATLKRVRAPSILHIATHGFFLENDSSVENRSTARTPDGSRLGKWVARVDNPLLRSGLALAGANQGRSGDDDGVLTALEATALDLWGTKLVVLSACDTGVGEVKNGDGVYGLRRALFLAGTESQLMSLWPVSDRSTRELMAEYYKGLVQNAGRGEALRRVQLKMLRNKSRHHPYYWASFILAGEWANLQGQR